MLVLGTAGEGILLEERERRLVADLFLQAADNRLQVAVQCGAQTTAETVALAAHAAEVGADAVVVIGPPYFRLDEQANTRTSSPPRSRAPRFRSTCTSSSRRAGTRSRRPCSNGSGTTHRISRASRCRTRRSSASRATCYPDLDIFVGPEALIHEGLAAGAVGAVSALASAFPRDVVAVVRDPTPEGAARLAELRAFVERFPRQAALKRLLGRQGVPVREDVRAPLRGLTTEERDQLDAWHAGL